MINELEKTIHQNEAETLFCRLNNPETYVLKHNRFNTYLVLIFSVLNKAQFFKMPHRDNPHHEIEKLRSLKYLELSKPNEHTEDYHNGGPNDEIFLFEIEEKKYIYVAGKLVSYETSNKIVDYSAQERFNDGKIKNAYGGENIYFTLHRKCIPIKENKNSTQKDEYEYLYGKDHELKGEKYKDENEGIVEYGNDFINCEDVHERDST